MTRLSQPTEFQTGSNPKRVERVVALARATVGWERVWPALWPASGIVGLFAAAALFNLLAPLPWPLHALLLSATITLTGLFLYLGLKDLKAPNWEDGARRVERDSQLGHRPISERADTLGAGTGDPWAEELWRAHLRRRLSETLRLRLSLPASTLAQKDPRALRFIVLLVVLGGLAVAGRGSVERLSDAFTSAGAGPGPSMDAWIDPPAYTGEAPIYLGRGQDRFLSVPAGALLNLRVHGAGHAPSLSGTPDGTGFSGSDGEYAATIRVGSDETLRVRAQGRLLGNWSFHAIADQPPVIAFTAAPSKTEHDAVKLAYAASDDYGVVSAQAFIRPHGKSGKTLVLELPVSGAKTVNETSYRDLTEHPYAGLSVDITLQAKDAIGQTGQSKTVTFTLPQRNFTNPLARALIEQRQNLASGGTQTRDTASRALDALTLAPERFYQNASGVYLGLRAAYWALRNAHHEDDFVHVEQLLWQIALAIEQGGLSAAAEELRRLQQMLTQALAQGAPQPIIDALLQRYQDALQRYMQSLAQNPPSSNEPVPKGAKVLSEKDLAALLQAIQQLAQSGDRQGAAQMLALLQSLLENLHMVAGSGQGQGDKALSDALKGLADVMGKQRALLDKTFRQQQQGKADGKALGQEQGQLRDQLNKTLKGLNGAKRDVPKELGDAGQAMGQSQQQLGQSDLDGAGETERMALDSLRRGAEALAKKMMEESNGQGNGNEQEDPLGRAQASGNSVKLPSKSDLQRAREILQELRKRAAERGRPKEELDYIDRLLKQF